MTIKQKTFGKKYLILSVYWSTEGSMYMDTTNKTRHTSYFHLHKITKEGTSALQLHILNLGIIIGINRNETPPDPPGHAATDVQGKCSLL